ncbi:MAG: ester cyclase [bacterium]|nr:ester cyclase [bacterium]
MSHPNDVLVRRWFEEVWNQRRLASIDELADPDCVGHSENGRLEGIDAWRAMFDAFIAAMPDLRATVEDVLVDGDRVSVRWSFTGTHTAALQDIPPTNRAIHARGTTWFRVADGRLVEAWDTWNQGALLASLARRA